MKNLQQQKVNIGETMQKIIQRINSNPHLKLARSLSQYGKNLIKKAGIHRNVVITKRH